MTTINIQFDPNSTAELGDALAVLDRLVALGPMPRRGAVAEMGTDSPSETGELAKQAVDDLHNRVGKTLWDLVATAAAIDGRFGLADVAAVLHEDVSMMVARFANLGRSLKRTEKRVPGAPTFFVVEEKTDAGWTFTMPQPIRDAVKQKVADERNAS